jgi:hypothetical protein
MMVQEERRRFPRYYAPASLKAVGEFPPNREYLLKVNDISIDGLSFDTEADLSKEAVFSLSLEITNPGGGVERISMLASILWYVYEKGTSLYTANAQFLGLKSSDKELLRSLFETLELKSG